MRFIERVKQFIRSQKIFQSGDVVLVGVSGGADSVALALALNDIKHELGIGIHLAHFNHGLRPEAEGDQDFVRSLAGQWNLSCAAGRPSVNLKTLQGSLEDHAREARLNFLVQAAAEVSATKIGLAHHKDDLAETVLMRILRGSGLQGMQAIRPVRVLKGVTFVRPLLCADRRDIEVFLKERNQSFRHDATNDRTDLTRNRVRHELLPLLKREYNPNAVSALANFSRIASDDYDFLEACARQAFEKMTVDRFDGRIDLPLDVICAYPRTLQRLIVRLAILELKGDLYQMEFAHWLETEDMMACRPDKSIVHWPSGIWIQKQESVLTIGLSKG